MAEYLNALGFDALPDEIRVVHGPKAKSDILECWHVYCKDSKGNEVEIASCFTLTALSRGLILEPGNTREAQIYGDWLAVPLPKGKTLVQLSQEGKL